MLFFLLFFSRFLVEINAQSLQPRALHVETCANQSQYKWLVSIQRDMNHTCNGLVIDKNIVMTTALCAKEKLDCKKKGPNPHITVVNTLEAKPGFPTGENCQITTVDRCVLHYMYEHGPYYIEYDTALLILSNNLSPYTLAPLTDLYDNGKDFSEICTQGMVVGWWYHYRQTMPSYTLECFPVTIKHLKKCAEVSTFVYLKKSKNHTLTCSYDASNRYEVCNAFYGAALICGGKVVGIISHKFNFSEQCEEVSPFYYSRIDWTVEFRKDFVGKNLTRRGFSFDSSLASGLESVSFFLVFLLTMCIVFIYE